ncbi:hypothetical protein, partial [Paracraurococcus ruber]|nr:hypothetical protein [Paracraurococcus ruber]
MRFLQIILLALALLPAVMGRPAEAQSQPAQSQPQGSAAALTPAELDRVTALLRDEARRNELLRMLEALAAVSRGVPPAGQPRLAAPQAAD